MGDTTKTALTGLGSSAIVGLGILPDVVSVIVGIVTIVYLVVKIYKELKD
tara:strand:- start:637 stop:786 length:150 start_codon:yes stop_codon:yes gene_type:complete